MGEAVQTGGLRRFVYEKNYAPKLSRQEKFEISDAYAKARERKEREKAARRRNWIIFIILILLVLIALAFAFFR